MILIIFFRSLLDGSPQIRSLINSKSSITIVQLSIKTMNAFEKVLLIQTSKPSLKRRQEGIFIPFMRMSQSSLQQSVEFMFLFRSSKMEQLSLLHSKSIFHTQTFFASNLSNYFQTSAWVILFLSSM